MLFIVNAVAAAVICVWATWCVLSPNVNDGIVGKLIFSCTALAAFACATSPAYELHTEPEVTLNVCLALLGIRHWMMRIVTPAIRRRMQRPDQNKYHTHGG